MNRILIVILAVIFCSGCGKLTVAEMRAKPAQVSQFYVEDSPQMVIRSVQSKQEECGYLWDGRVTTLDELGEAHIEYRSGGTPGAELLLFLVDLKKQDGKTSVSIYSANSSFTRGFKTLEYGAKGIRGCP